MRVRAQAGSDPSLSVAPAELSFSPGDWATPQTVTVSAAQDDDTVDGSAEFTHTVVSADVVYNAVPADSVTVTATDNDTAGVIVAADPA